MKLNISCLSLRCWLFCLFGSLYIEETYWRRKSKHTAGEIKKQKEFWICASVIMSSTHRNDVQCSSAVRTYQAGAQYFLPLGCDVKRERYHSCSAYQAHYYARRSTYLLYTLLQPQYILLHLLQPPPNQTNELHSLLLMHE